MKWQDIAIALAQLTFIGALIPAIRKHSTLPLITTAGSFLASTTLLVAVASLGLWIAASIATVKTAMWGVLAIQSYRVR